MTYRIKTLEESGKELIRLDEARAITYDPAYHILEFWVEYDEYPGEVIEINKKKFRLANVISRCESW